MAQCGLDLTAEAKAGRLDPCLGRDEEIAALMRVLVRRRKSNPCLVGDPGVGKTALVEGLAQVRHSPPLSAPVRPPSPLSASAPAPLSEPLSPALPSQRIAAGTVPPKAKLQILLVAAMATYSFPPAS